MGRAAAAGEEIGGQGTTNKRGERGKASATVADRLLRHKKAAGHNSHNDRAAPDKAPWNRLGGKEPGAWTRMQARKTPGASSGRSIHLEIGGERAFFAKIRRRGFERGVAC